ncbi:MAG: clostripain family protease, partial [Cyanobacteria bacterium P01_H01_bin.130]
DSERLSMYHTMTLVDNQSVPSIPDKLAPLVEAIANASQSRSKAVKLPTYRYFEERHCDALALLQSFDQGDRNIAKQFRSFSNFLRTKVVSHYRTGGTIYGWHIAILSPPEQFCGLSLYLPETRQSIDRYESMALNQKVGLSRLYEIFLEGVETHQSGRL